MAIKQICAGCILMISQIHEKQHINQQPCTTVLAIYYVAYPSSCWKHQPKHDYSIPCKTEWWIYDENAQPQKKELPGIHKVSNFLRDNFHNTDNVGPPIQLIRGRKLPLKNHFKRWFWPKTKAHPFSHQ